MMITDNSDKKMITVISDNWRQHKNDVGYVVDMAAVVDQLYHISGGGDG